MKFHTKQWHEDHASVQRSAYGDGSTSLIVKGRWGQVLCDATICLSDYRQQPQRGNVFIRDWGDNEGVLYALQDAGIVGRTLRTLPSGTVKGVERLVHECQLLEPR